MPKRKLSIDEGSNDSEIHLPAKRSAPRTKSSRQQKKKPHDQSDDDYMVNDSDPVVKSHSISLHVLSSPGPLRVALLDWFAGVHDSRGMPWRKPYEPSFGRDERAQRAYEVWVSEIMLQQTQVVTVIPYYQRWLAKFPTIKDLAASDIETVNSLWKGLGYYSRAARLFSGAKKVMEEFDGRLPDNAKDMERHIPGIGRYSAGAICSIAYNECAPVLDGNVHRLLSRVLALHAHPKAKATLDILWSGATALVEGADQPGNLNQAMIELGSTVCKVRDPTCGDCPLQKWCQAYQRAKDLSHDTDIEDMCSLCEPLLEVSVTAYPMKVERKKARQELDIVNVVEWRCKENRWFLLVRRPEGGLLAGLHEFPTSPNVTAASASELTSISLTMLSTIIKPIIQSHLTTDERSPDMLRIATIQPAGDVIHVFSHIRKTYRVQWVVLEGGGSSPPELTQIPLASQQKPEARGKGKQKKTGTNSTAAVKWTLLDQVTDANIGTGVLKVWKQARLLWEGR